MVNVFWTIFYHWTNIGEDTIIPRILSIRGERFFLQVFLQKIFCKKNQGPFKLCENGFSKFCFFKRARGAEYKLNIVPWTINIRSNSGPFSPDYNRGSVSHQTYHQYWTPEEGASSASAPSVSFQAIQMFWIPASCFPPCTFGVVAHHIFTKSRPCITVKLLQQDKGKLTAVKDDFGLYLGTLWWWQGSQY